MENSGLRLSDTVCTATLGPINMHAAIQLLGNILLHCILQKYKLKIVLTLWARDTLWIHVLHTFSESYELLNHSSY
jgi:hypothetical protein